MIVLLETTSGASVGKQVRLLPGQSIRVGRTRKSDLVLPGDSHISSVHFSVEVDETGCRLTDLNSTNGTLLNGQKITAATLQNGDTIVAGETTFRATIESSETPAAGQGLAADATLHQRLLAVLRNNYQPLYAVLDAARDIKVLAFLMQSKEEHQSLYEGVEGAKRSQVAPYLVKLGQDSLLLGSLLLEGWGNGWGVYLTCDSEFPEVRRHLRRFLEVQVAEGKQVSFRFYDPQVLCRFLPTCSPQEANQFFGPVKYYLMEDGKPNKLLEFGNTGRGTEKRSFDVSGQEVREDKRLPSTPESPTLTWLEKPPPDQLR
jgi:pSer/pThr/pTyr-binding forkhead associated (FHA) protein